MSDSKRLEDLFSKEELEQALCIYSVSKLDMTHCAQCSTEVFGNWLYEEGKYMCSNCGSVLA